MKLRRTWAVARKEFLHVLRDFRSLAMALAMPVMMLMLFGYALTLDVDNVPMAVWDQSGTTRSRDLISRFWRLALLFAVRTSRGQLRDLVSGPSTGEVMMGLVVPRDFAQQIDAGRDAAAAIASSTAATRTRPPSPSATPTSIAQIYALDLSLEQDQRRGGRGRRNPLGRAAAGLVQRGPGIEKLHHSGPDRRDHDGDRGDADVA